MIGSLKAMSIAMELPNTMRRIMQKVFNLMALLSFLVSGATVAGAFYLYKNADVMIEEAREQAIKEIAEAIPKIVEEMMPDIPEVPEVTGGSIPPATGLPF